jgi:hypothetical protein
MSNESLSTRFERTAPTNEAHRREVARAFAPPPADGEGDSPEDQLSAAPGVEGEADSGLAPVGAPAPVQTPGLGANPQNGPPARPGPNERLELLLDGLRQGHLVGKAHSQSARLERQLARMPAPQREMILLFILENGFNPEDPEVVLASLMGHLVALSQEIPAQIDASADRAVAQFAAHFSGLPDQIYQALADAVEAVSLTEKSIQAKADNFEIAVRESLTEAIGAASQEAAETIAARRDQAIDEVDAALRASASSSRDLLARLEKFAEERLAKSSAKLASEGAAAVKAAVKERDGKDAAWKWAALALGGMVVGMAIMVVVLQR